MGNIKIASGRNVRTRTNLNVPELYFACFGALKLGAIIVPLFSAFGPQAVKDRFDRASGSVLITTPTLLAKLETIRKDLPSLAHVILIPRPADAERTADGKGVT